MGLLSRIRGWFFSNKISVRVYGDEFTVDVSRFARNLTQAQIWLNTQVVADSNKFVPFQTGTLRSSVYYPEGMDGGAIEWNTPYAHYLHEGEVYINPKYNASGYIGKDGMWHGWKGQKIPSGRKLKYNTAGTGDHWFRRARDAYGEEWIRGVRRVAGGR